MRLSPYSNNMKAFKTSKLFAPVHLDLGLIVTSKIHVRLRLKQNISVEKVSKAKDIILYLVHKELRSKGASVKSFIGKLQGR